MARRELAVILAATALAALRLCHVKLLWADEDYHLAAALQMLHRRLPYRDFWYDKPPLSALYYLLIGGHAGWPLRILDAGYVLVGCYLAYRIARSWWGKEEGLTAALLLAFFFAFYLPSAAIAFAPDALMVAPHLGAILLALEKRAFWSGVCCAAAFLVNAKAVFVLITCALWSATDGLVLLAAGFFAVLAGALGLAAAGGVLRGYWEQVWGWGWLYARQAPTANALARGFSRTVNWAGFHCSLVAGTILTFARSRSDRWKLGTWLALSFAAVCAGARFEPRYFLQLVPPMVIAGSRGMTLAWRWNRSAAAWVFGIFLLIPLARFGPRYGLLAYDGLRGRPPAWGDAALDLDSQEVARRILALKQEGDTLFVWGYRPDIYVWTRMISPGEFWDSQPLTGVPADRHLTVSAPISYGLARQNRMRFAGTRPSFLVDGLSLLNPKLRPDSFAELQDFSRDYQLVGRTGLSLIYRRRGGEKR